MWNKLIKMIQRFWRNFAYCTLGTLVCAGWVVFVAFSLPVYLYRWLVCQVLAPHFRKGSGKALTVASSAYATEFTKMGSCARPRCAVVVTTTLEGAMTIEKLRDVIHRRWITAERSEGAGLVYPEMQQCLERWMGYIFWKQDEEFNLQNHLVQHKCQETWDHPECERFVISIVEDLLNNPFLKGRSPWEAHVISGYKNAELGTEGKEVAVVIFRFHHCLADGYGILSVFCEGIFEKPLSQCGIAIPVNSGSGMGSSKSSSWTSFMKLISLGGFPIKVIRDMGLTFAKLLHLPKTPWHVPEGKRAHRQLYIRSEKVPISRIKFVKDQFGVSFTSVLLSSIAAGIANSFEAKKVPNHVRKILFGLPAPLKDHPHKLRNHSTLASCDLPVEQKFTSIERLKESEKQLRIAKGSTVPVVWTQIMKLFALHLPSVSKQLFTNRAWATGMSNFPGPGIKLSAHGWDVLSCDFTAGLALGCGGTFFQVLSYCDHIRIAVVAEKAAVRRKELEELISVIVNEIDDLHDLAMSEERYEVRASSEQLV